jgi:hypothetical protein
VVASVCDPRAPCQEKTGAALFSSFIIHAVTERNDHTCQATVHSALLHFFHLTNRDEDLGALTGSWNLNLTTLPSTAARGVVKERTKEIR